MNETQTRVIKRIAEALWRRATGATSQFDRLPVHLQEYWITTATIVFDVVNDNAQVLWHDGSNAPYPY